MDYWTYAKGKGRALVVSARDMDEREKKSYGEK
jgi:hypothetical protein